MEHLGARDKQEVNEVKLCVLPLVKTSVLSHVGDHSNYGLSLDFE